MLLLNQAEQQQSQLRERVNRLDWSREPRSANEDQLMAELNQVRDVLRRAETREPPAADGGELSFCRRVSVCGFVCA